MAESNHPEIDKFDLVSNVGGKEFTTTQAILSSSHAQASLFSKADGRSALHFDRDPKHFPQVLNFLRDGWIALPQEKEYLHMLREMRREAEFYGLTALCELICQTHAMREFLAAIVARDVQETATDRGTGRAGPRLPPMRLPTETAYTLAALRRTASASEIRYAEELARRQRIQLKMCNASGNVLGEFEVDVRAFVLDGLMEAVENESLAEALHKIAFPDSDRQAPRIGHDRLAIPRLRSARDTLLELEIVTQNGDALTQDWASSSTFELLGIKDGETLTVVKLQPLFEEPVHGPPPGPPGLVSPRGLPPPQPSITSASSSGFLPLVQPMSDRIHSGPDFFPHGGSIRDISFNSWGTTQTPYSLCTVGGRPPPPPLFQHQLSRRITNHDLLPRKSLVSCDNEMMMKKNKSSGCVIS